MSRTLIFPHALLDLGLALLRLGRDRTALEHLQRIELPTSEIDEHPAQWLTRQYLLAEVLAKLGKMNVASSHFADAETQLGQRRGSLTVDEQGTVAELRQSAAQRIARDTLKP